MGAWDGLASPVTSNSDIWAGTASPLQAQQQTGQPETQRPNAIPANSNEISNNQNNPLQNISAWAHSPTNVDLSDLPQTGQGLSFAQKLGYGAQTLGRGALGVGEDMIVKPAVGGLADLMSRMKTGYLPAGSDSSSDPNILSGNELGTLGMLSPTSVALSSKMGIGSETQGDKIKNQLVKFGSEPTEAGQVEDQAFNTLMAKNPQSGSSGSTLMKGFSAVNPEDLQGIADSMKASAGKIYDQMRQTGAVFTDDKTDDIVEDIDNALKSKEFIPQLNPKTVAIVDHIKKAAEDDNLGLDQLDQYRRLLGRIGNTEDGVSAGLVKRAIDTAVGSSQHSDFEGSTALGGVSLLNQGRKAYQQASKFEDVADILSKANGDPNRIKSMLQRFSANDENTRGWTISEKAALNEAANTGIGENLLKAFGKFGFDFSKSGTGNTVLPALSMTAGTMGMPLGVPLAVGGTIARQSQKYLARGKAQNLLDILQNGEK